LGNKPANQATSLARKPLALANTRAASAVKKSLSVAAPVKLTSAKPAPVVKQTADSEWESF
jgi:hypothetical protein